MASSPSPQSPRKRPLEPDTEESTRKKSAVEVEVQDAIVLTGNDANWMQKRLTEFRAEEKMIDVIVACGTLRIPCHRTMLATGSDYFLTLFETSNPTSFSDSQSTTTLSTDDVAPDALAKSIDFLYESKLECCEEQLQSLGAAASYLHIGALLQSVAQSMTSGLSVSNCVSTWIFADKYSLEALASVASSFVAKHFQVLAVGSLPNVEAPPEPVGSLMALPMDLMADLLSKESLRPRSEQTVYDVAIEWLRKQGTPPSDADAIKLISSVRVALLPRTTADGMLHEPLLSGPSCREVLFKSFVAAAHGEKPSHRFPDTVADDDDNMSWACDVTVMRLVKKAKKENLMALCADFGVPVSSNKEALAHNLAEQLHYETDEEDDA